MTTHTLPVPAPPVAPAAPAHGARRADRQVAVVAGVGLLVLAALAVFAKTVVLDGLVTPADAARTAADISASPTLFRWGVVSLFAVVALDVVVAWALYRVFARVDAPVSLLAAWLRLAYAAVFLVAAGLLLDVPRLLDSSRYTAVFPLEQRQAQALARIDAFGDVWTAALVVFGLHLLVLGNLAYRSRFVPRTIGVLLAVAGAGYVLDSVVAVVAPHTVPTVSSVTFLGEFLLALWLVVRNRRVGEV
jgi:Domain of unknown function (DUF4386)